MEYPKMVYPHGRSESGVYEKGAEPVIVQDAEEEDDVMGYSVSEIEAEQITAEPKKRGRPRKVA